MSTVNPLSAEPSIRHRRFVERFGREPLVPIPRILDDDESMSQGYETVIEGSRDHDIVLDHDETTLEDRVGWRIGVRMALDELYRELVVCPVCGIERLVVTIRQVVKFHLESDGENELNVTRFETTQDTDGAYLVHCGDPDCSFSTESSPWATARDRDVYEPAIEAANRFARWGLPTFETTEPRPDPTEAP